MVHNGICSYGDEMSDIYLKKFRTRWKRWLGQKTRVDKPYWTTLLDSNWVGWVEKVLGDDYRPIGITTIEKVKQVYMAAINRADFNQLYKLDSLYANEKFEKSFHR